MSQPIYPIAIGDLPPLRDIRATDIYRRAEALHAALWPRGRGAIADAADLVICPDERSAWFTATIVDPDGGKRSRIARIDLASGKAGLIDAEAGSGRSPAPAPGSSFVAYLSDQLGDGAYQLQLLDRDTGAIRRGPPVHGSIEHLAWSPDGRRLLLSVASCGADSAGAQGAVRGKREQGELPEWMPHIDSGSSDDQRRYLLVYDPLDGRTMRVGPSHLTIWEARWCGDDHVAIIASLRPDEGGWYGAALHRIDLADGRATLLFMPEEQLGVLACSPDGRWIACVEAICSDRTIIAGELRLVDRASGAVQPVTLPIDASALEWRTAERLLVSGHQGLDSVVGTVDVPDGHWRERWRSGQLSSGGLFMTATGLGPDGDCAFIAEGFADPPHLVIVRSGKAATVARFGTERGSGKTLAAPVVEPVRWAAPDGLEIEGLLLRPSVGASGAVIVNVHGGPVWHWRPAWLGRAMAVSMLLEQGCSVFLPNPRGSTGRGQAFVRPVVGDMGGADAGDILAGIDTLVARGLADPQRIGVMGRSYGGFMTYCLTARAPRFAAAVAIAPMSNFVTQWLTSNIPDFCSRFLAGAWTDVAGDAFARSPVFQAELVRAPMLSICGALDRCTPAIEAAQFHSALLQAGKVKSTLLTYPQEGHGIRGFPAECDYAARITEWFKAYLTGPGTRPANGLMGESLVWMRL